MPNLLTPLPFLDASGQPANGFIFAQATSPFTTATGIVTTVQSMGRVVNGVFLTADDSKSDPFVLMPATVDAPLQITIKLNSYTTEGKLQSGYTGVQSRTVTVPDVGTVAWSDLVDVVQTADPTPYVIQPWMQDAMDNAAAASASAATATTKAGEAAASAASIVRGGANGVAPLDAGSKVPDANLPTRLGVSGLSATFARSTYFEPENYKTGTNTDLEAIHAAAAAATAAGNGNMLRLSARTWDVGSGLSLSGYSCGIVGMSSGHDGGGPTGTVIRAATQAGAVLDLTGWIAPDAFRGIVEIGMFSIQGSNVADPGKLNVGLLRAGTFANEALGSVWIHDVAISQTGGAGVDIYDMYLSNMDRVVVTTPVGAKANDVAYMLFRGCNGNRFTGLGLRSISASNDTGVSGALIVTDDGTYHSEANVWDAPWAEYLHIPTDGCIINNRASQQSWRDPYFVDVSKETGATGTAFMRLAESAFSDYGGNHYSGMVPGSDVSVSNSPDVGIAVTQSNNLITGVKGYKGQNVSLSARVNNTTVILGGSISGATEPAVINGSTYLNNVIIDHVMRSHTMGVYTQRESLGGVQFASTQTPGNGLVALGTGGVLNRSIGTGLYHDAETHYFRGLDGTEFGFIDRYAGWKMSGPVELVNPGTQTVAPAAGVGAALPATPAGYVSLTIAGTVRKIPYY